MVIMVVRPTETIDPDATAVMPTKSSPKENGKQPSNKNGHSMSRKYVSMSPARGGGGVPRSKSMNGLSRIDANKINEKGRTSNHSTGRNVRHRETSSSENGSPNTHNGLSNG